MKERILDIGIGSGGDYLWDRPKTEERVGVDINLRELKLLKKSHPEIQSIRASGEHLPFGNSIFQRIELVLPDDTLVYPGVESLHSNGWYPEFQRVLSPLGKITIYGDMLIDPQLLAKTAGEYFAITSTQKLSLQQYESLGTVTSTYGMERWREVLTGQTKINWEAGLIKIEMISKKAL